VSPKVFQSTRVYIVLQEMYVPMDQSQTSEIFKSFSEIYKSPGILVEALKNVQTSRSSYMPDMTYPARPKKDPENLVRQTL